MRRLEDRVGEGLKNYENEVIVPRRRRAARILLPIALTAVVAGSLVGCREDVQPGSNSNSNLGGGGYSALPFFQDQLNDAEHVYLDALAGERVNVVLLEDSKNMYESLESRADSLSSSQNAEVQFYLGSIYYAMRNYAEAAEHFGEALKYAPESAGTHWNYADAQFYLGNYDLAREHFAISEDLNPDLKDWVEGVEGNVSVGRSLTFKALEAESDSLRDNYLRSAEESFLRAREADPHHLYPILSLADHYLAYHGDDGISLGKALGLSNYGLDLIENSPGPSTLYEQREVQGIRDFLRAARDTCNKRLEHGN